MSITGIHRLVRGSTMSSKAALVRMLLILGMISVSLLAGCADNAAKPPAPSPTPNPTPAIATISPASAQAGSASFTLTVNGTNFISASVINFGGTPLATTFVNATQLTAAVPAADVALAGTMTVVTVTNPAPGGGTSNGANFTITTGIDAVPTIFSNGLDPSCAPVAGGDFTLLLFGTNFASDSVVQWNGANLPTTVEASFNGPVLFAQVPGSDIAAAGTATITVSNPAGDGTSNAVSFTVSAGGISPQSIAVDPTGKFAYTANNGCADAFTGSVSMYTVDATTGTLSLIGPPVDTGDFDPLSIAIDPFSKFVYVASWGGGDTAGSVAMYTINATTGALTGTGVIDGVCPGLCSPWSVVVHPSGKFAYVADEGGFAPTGISMFAVDAASGALSSLGTVTAAGRVNSVLVDPTGKFAYATDDLNDAEMYTVNSTTGALTFTGTVAAGTEPVATAVDPLGKFAYVANATSNDVSMYTINGTTGALTSIGTIAAGTKPVSLAVHPTGKFAYVANSGSGDISMYTIDSATGALTFMGTTTTPGSCLTSITIHPSGKFVYLTDACSNSVLMYGVDDTTGALTLIGTVGT